MKSAVRALYARMVPKREKLADQAVVLAGRVIDGNANQGLDLVDQRLTTIGRALLLDLSGQ